MFLLDEKGKPLEMFNPSNDLSKLENKIDSQLIRQIEL